MPAGIGYPAPDASANIFQNPEVQALIMNMMRQGSAGGQGGMGQMPMMQPRQAPQVVQPDLGPQQNTPMGMNPMFAQMMQRLGRPGGVAAATMPAMNPDVAAGLTGGGYGGGGIGSR